MAINLDAFESYVKILVIGVGGGGSNAVNEMIDDNLKSIDFWVFNTDAQALATSKSPNRLVLGERVTKGLGAGGLPEIGKKAAEDSLEAIQGIVKNYDMVFVACGEGGGTGTGAAPVVAKAAKDIGALTVAIVTRPFTFEGNLRLKRATAGIAELKQNVDSLIIVSNDKLMFMNGKRPIMEAFNESDKVLAQSVKTITDLILLPGVINLDFADVRNTLKDKGMALIGFGTGSGQNKAKEAANAAIASPLLEASIRGAKSAIVNITGGVNVTLDEAQEAVKYIAEIAGGDVNIIFGVQTNPQFDDTMLVSVIATDFDEDVPLTPASIMPSRVSHADDTAENAVPAASTNPNVNPAQVSDDKPDFSESDDILPSFFSKMQKAAKDKFVSQDNSQDDDKAPVSQPASAPSVPAKEQPKPADDQPNEVQPTLTDESDGDEDDKDDIVPPASDASVPEAENNKQ